MGVSTQLWHPTPRQIFNRAPRMMNRDLTVDDDVAEEDENACVVTHGPEHMSPQCSLLMQKLNMYPAEQTCQISPAGKDSTVWLVLDL